ncbi:MAG: hypothetical protein R3B06_26335 [Kofleriaceae bacterium]
MTEAEFLERVEVWALGGLSDIERAQMERYLAGTPSPACVAACARAFDAAALLAASVPPSPPPADGWARLADGVDQLRAGARRPAPSRKVAATRAWLVTAAVAAIVIVLLVRDRGRHVDREAQLAAQVRAQQAQLDAAQPTLAAVASTRTALDGCTQELTRLQAKDALATEAVALLELPGTQLIPLDRPGPVTTPMAANAIYHRGVKRAYVVAAGIPADAPTDGYQVWLVRGGKRIAAGTLHPDQGRAIAVVPTFTLDDGVPETFQLALASGEIVLESQIRI